MGEMYLTGCSCMCIEMFGSRERQSSCLGVKRVERLSKCMSEVEGEALCVF